MGAQTIMSEKGQIVIPKDVREALGFAPGQRFEVIRTGRGVLLHPAVAKSGRSGAELLGEIRKITASYKGPPVSIDEINETVAAEWAKSGLRGDW